MGTIGQLSRAACIASSLPRSARDSGVSSGPGLTALTLMLYSTSSIAIVFTRLMMPAFETP